MGGMEKMEACFQMSPSMCVKVWVEVPVYDPKELWERKK